MEITIREPNLEIMTKEGIPKCFADIRDYFNEALETNSLPWIPRKTIITNDEIKNLWIPSLKTNITLHAELNSRVVGSGTVFYDTKSTGYEHTGQRVPGNFGFTADPKYYFLTFRKMMPFLVEKLKKQNKTAIFTSAIESPAIKIMENLGYKGKLLENQDRYKQAGLSGKIMEYHLP